MIPLAERLRPRSIDEIIGQKELLGEDGIIRRAIASKRLPSMIFWGPPGVGKTTLAKVFSKELDVPFISLSAINSGVKDVREAIAQASRQQFFDRPNPILFIDEIHRFSKSQQDSLLGAVEQGIVTFIGATTENPSFEVISALLSRCQVFVLKSLDESELHQLVERALTVDHHLKDREISLKEHKNLFRISGGDARKLLNALELVCDMHKEDPLVISDELVESSVQQNLARYDKNGEMHYDVISAFIKSVRGSDPQAAVYWLARMLKGGEDIKFIARRLVILAAEDVGLANPNALLMANTCFDAIHKIGMPEARIILSEATIYLATSPKSNSAYAAINMAMARVDETGDLPVPLNIRNAPTSLMKELGYGKDYKYAHSYDSSFVEQEFLPAEIGEEKFYVPGKNPIEMKILERLKAWWKKRY